MREAMGANAENDAESRSEQLIPDRYAAIETGAGDLVVFDVEGDDAWIQTSYSTALSEIR